MDSSFVLVLALWPYDYEAANEVSPAELRLLIWDGCQMEERFGEMDTACLYIEGMSSTS